MTTHSNKRKHKTGRPPGTLLHIGDKKAEKVKITVIDYSTTECSEKTVATVEEALEFRPQATVTWINVDAIHDIEVVEKIGKHFNIDYLVLEDILNTGHHPKVEDFDDYIYIVLKMLSFDKELGEIKAEQISIVIGSNYVLTFQEVEGDVLDPVRRRIQNPNGRFRRFGSDYLAYALVDTIIDHYFLVVENIKDRLEEIEDELLETAEPETIHELHKLKRDLVVLRKNTSPLREMLTELEHGDSPLIGDETKKYLRDVRDHVIQVVETADSVRDILSGLQDVHLTIVSNRMNEVMKVLTIIATIFIPLTFIAGLYGMNFKYMPELEWPWGYPLALLAMAAISVVMFVFFKMKKWF